MKKSEDSRGGGKKRGGIVVSESRSVKGYAIPSDSGQQALSGGITTSGPL